MNTLTDSHTHLTCFILTLSNLQLSYVSCNATTNQQLGNNKWDTKDKGHETCIVNTQYAKNTNLVEAIAMSNSEKIKPVALAVIKLHLSEGISQSGSQSAENSTK